MVIVMLGGSSLWTKIGKSSRNCCFTPSLALTHLVFLGTEDEQPFAFDSAPVLGARKHFHSICGMEILNYCTFFTHIHTQVEEAI